MRSQEFTGRTTQEAIDAGLAAFGVTIADVHVDVLEEGAKGLFGLFGSRPARVRMTVMEDEREDDHGLSDLLGSFSLSEPQAKKKPKPEPAVKAEPAAKPAAKAEPVAKPVVKAEPVAKAEPAVKAEPAIKAEPARKAEPAVKAVSPAKAAPEAQEEPAPKAEAAERKPKAPRPKKQPKPEEKAAAPAQPAFAPTEPPVIFDEATPAGRAQRFLMDVIERMGVKADVYVTENNEDSLYLHIIGDTLGVLIGRRGETLDALQYLTSLQVNKGREGYIRVTLDTENYRAKREDSLRRLALRMANRAQKTGRRVVLEPMNPYERRVLHTALQNHPAVTTHSEGEEPNRRVVILLKGQPERSAEKGEQKGEQKPSGTRRGGRGRRRGSRRKAQGSSAAQQAFEQTEMTEASSRAAHREEGTVDATGVEE